MGSRSRKRSRTGDEAPVKKRRVTQGTPAAPPAPVVPAPSRGEARADEIRAQLEPLAPGERPLPLIIAAVVAGLLSVINLVLFAAGTEIDGEKPSTVGTLTFCGLMLVAAIGMWKQRYWAVLGFQTILALIIVLFSIFLLRASNVLGLVVALAIIGAAGWLFFRLVRVMARLQMPERRRPS